MKFRFNDDNGIYYEFKFVNLPGTVLYKELHVVTHNPPLIPHFSMRSLNDDKTIHWVRNDGNYYISDNAKRYITKVLKNLAFV